TPFRAGEEAAERDRRTVVLGDGRLVRRRPIHAVPRRVLRDHEHAYRVEVHLVIARRGVRPILPDIGLGVEVSRLATTVGVAFGVVAVRPVDGGGVGRRLLPGRANDARRRGGGG